MSAEILVSPYGAVKLGLADKTLEADPKVQVWLEECAQLIRKELHSSLMVPAEFIGIDPATGEDKTVHYDVIVNPGHVNEYTVGAPKCDPENCFCCRCVNESCEVGRPCSEQDKLECEGPTVKCHNYKNPDIRVCWD